MSRSQVSRADRGRSASIRHFRTVRRTTSRRIGGAAASLLLLTTALVAAGTLLTASPSGATNAVSAFASPPTCGGWTNYTVPAGIVSASVILRGGGGGGGRSTQNPGSAGNGGGGAGVTTTVTGLTGGSSVALTIGCGGGGGRLQANPGGAGGTSAFGPGGTGGGGTSSVADGGGGGGGSTALCVGSSGCTTPLVAAAGGGGGGAKYRGTGSPAAGNGGESSGGTTTEDGSSGGSASGCSGTGCVNGGGGGGGTTTTGTSGSVGAAGSNGGTAGSARTGGVGGNGSDFIGGGGGGGGLWAGGGGGGGNGSTAAGGGGGAGSNYSSSGTVSYLVDTTKTNGCGQVQAACTTATDPGRGGNKGANNGGTGSAGNGFTGFAGAASIIWNVGGTSLGITAQPPSTTTVAVPFNFSAVVRDFQGNTVTADSLGTPTVTLNPGVGCGPLASQGSSSYNSGTGVITVTGARIDTACANNSTLTISVLDTTTGLTISGTTSAFTTIKANQTISFTSTAPSGAVFAGPTYTVTATATSGLAVAFTSGTPAVCTVSGSTVSFVGVGTCTINANQAGNANYNAAPQVSQSFTVNKGAQAITFTSPAPGSAVVGGPTYTVTANGGPSGNPVTFTSATPGVCTVSGSTVSFVGAGTCTINANQAGNANYNAAPQVSQSFGVGQASQVITFTSTNPSPVTFGDGPYTVTATGGGSGNPVTFSLDGSSTGCSLSGSVVTFTGAGTCKVNANQAGNANYLAAAQVQQTIVINKANQTIAFTSTAPSPGLEGDTYTVTATGGGSGNPVTFSLDGTSTGCTLSSAVVTFTGAGTCRVNADQLGNLNYNAAPQVQQVITVLQRNATTTGLACQAATQPYDGANSCTVTITDTNGSPITPTGAVTLSGVGDGTASFSTCNLTQVSVGVASCVVSVTVTLQDSYVLTASKVADSNHQGSTSSPVSVKFGARTTSISVSCSPSTVVAGTPTTCTATVTDVEPSGTQVSPAGTVTFGQSGGGSFSPSTSCVLAAGASPSSSCSVQYTPTFSGSHTVNAFYASNTSGAAAGGFKHKSASSTSFPVGVTGNTGRHSTTTSVSCTPNPVAVGSPTTCTATVTDTYTFGPKSTPTGTVQWGYSGGGSFSSSTCTLTVLVANQSSKCSVTYTPASAGNKTVNAFYKGTPTHFTSYSGSVAVVATSTPPPPPPTPVRHPTSMALVCSPSSVPVNTATTCTATVTDTYTGTKTEPTGTVTFGYSGGGTLSPPTCTLVGNGDGESSACSTQFTPTGSKGNKTVNATYNGTPAHKKSVSGSIPVTAT